MMISLASGEVAGRECLNLTALATIFSLAHAHQPESCESIFAGATTQTEERREEFLLCLLSLRSPSPNDVAGTVGGGLTVPWLRKSDHLGMFSLSRFNLSSFTKSVCYPCFSRW
jgi:hypothetical protein